MNKRLGIFLLLIAVRIAVAQSSFEVATIKPNESNVRRNTQFAADTLTITNLPLANIMIQAYMPSGEMSFGSFEEIFRQRYDIVAKAATHVRRDEMRRMLQTLLADRFHMQLHHEVKFVPGYVLAVEKDGPRLTASATPDDEPDFDKRLGQDLPRQTIKFKNAGMELLALLLREQADMSKLRPGPSPIILDRTGLKGGFDFTLEWTWDEPSPGDTAPPERLPVLIGALHKLGLTLKSEKVPLDVLVVDHVDKAPREN